jgi:predicted ATP-dependent endonuclease of OLD family
MRPRAVILVEGVSDQRAVEAVAERRRRDLAAEGVAVVPIGGAQAIGSASSAPASAPT